MWFNDIKIVIFPKIAQRQGVHPPQPPAAGGAATQTPLCDTVGLTYTSLFNTSPKLDIFPPRLAKSWLHAETDHSF